MENKMYSFYYKGFLYGVLSTKMYSNAKVNLYHIDAIKATYMY